MRSLPKFFALVYVVSWICWLFVAWLGGGTFAPNSSVAAIAAPIFYVGVFAPAIVALLLSIFERGRPGAAELLKQIANFPKQARWYVFAILYMAAIKLSAAVLHRLAFNAWPAFGTEPLILMAIATMISTPFQAGEEIGWRGYALPRLAFQIGLRTASIIIGVIWPAGICRSSSFRAATLMTSRFLFISSALPRSQSRWRGSTGGRMEACCWSCCCMPP